MEPENRGLHGGEGEIRTLGPTSPLFRFNWPGIGWVFARYFTVNSAEKMFAVSSTEVEQTHLIVPIERQASMFGQQLGRKLG